MSFIQSTKEFFGLGPAPVDVDDAYYDDEPDYRRSDDPMNYDSRREREYDAPRVAEPRRYTPSVLAMELHSYTEASRIGEPFRDGDAIVFDLTRMEHGEARRVIDFAAGLCFGLRGQMKKLDRLVFAIIPEGATVSTYELDRALRLR
ncbi:cell division protein SepF [Corynebacterium poyangense]|uniref:Cell division protein SepF n=1 Tax=Corynebacterium poyangense TaxID=2684405 RepID=A0A7H0SPS9_9CORY|nr:cell division protein SepF [Corynebacterium poyangense]MBZ8178141.1 cell division protein SepF [Corynebacterium poyangense]QNQ90554.1 cell division protein SepF [Corynebacterium poyangense]